MVHRHGIDHGGIWQPRGGNQAGPGFIGPHSPEIRLRIRLLRANQWRDRIADLHIGIVRRHDSLRDDVFRCPGYFQEGYGGGVWFYEDKARVGWRGTIIFVRGVALYVCLVMQIRSCSNLCARCLFLMFWNRHAVENTRLGQMEVWLAVCGNVIRAVCSLLNKKCR